MNILILGGSDGSFNQIRPEYEMYIGLKNRGHKITIVIKPDSVYLPRLKEIGVKLLFCYPDQKISLKTIIALRRELSNIHYDIIFANSSKTIPSAAIAATGFPAKLVTYRGTTGGAYRHDPTNYLTILNPIADGVVCVSEAVRQYLLPRFRNRKTRLITIHKGHDIAWYKNPPTSLLEFGITNNDFPIACVANARAYKGLKYLLEAAKSLAHISNLHIILVGRNISVEPYISLIAKSGMAERIHMTGFRHDAPEIIAACKTLIIPSIREGLPRVLLESMGYGVPPIATDSGGCAEVVDDEESGYIVPVKDPDAISDRVIRLYENPQLIQSMSKKCLRKIAADLSIQVTVDRYIHFFETLLNNNSSTS
ncbi:MAG: glycosyltransferase [Gammaproteobacteria bacterium]|jgi:glycosyltransferase involved in cell wall biosynthesis|nr:glycosyl transferase family 1 [Chromatiales bacterium]MDP6673560.1 glycosyltransferase [Gammaproteobacteria bacterium]